MPTSTPTTCAAMAAAVGLLLCSTPATAQTMTPILYSGDSGSRLDLVIIGEGFQVGPDQAAFSQFVQDNIIDGAFASGPLMEDMASFNIWRLDLPSVDSGVTQIDATGAVTLARSTPLGYRYSGIWGRCWMEVPVGSTALGDLLKDWAPQWDYALVVINEVGFGGCSDGATMLTVTMDPVPGPNVIRHELGHMVGNLCDEYFAGAAAYSGGELGCVNLTNNPQGSKWDEFIPEGLALPTIFAAASMDPYETTGAFAGGTLGQLQFASGIYRPTSSGVMTDNTDEYGSVDYRRVKNVLRTFNPVGFGTPVVGDFDGDGRDDLFLHDGTQMSLHLSDPYGGQLVPTWFATGTIPGWGEIGRQDQFVAADFDGDGLDDLYVWNGTEFPSRYLGMLRSTGTSLEAVAVYVDQLNGWAMRPHDVLVPGDFDGDGDMDLYLANTLDWPVGYLGLFRSTGNGLDYTRRYDKSLPGWAEMAPHDQFIAADVDGDGRDDLYVLNTVDWAGGYLEALLCDGSALVPGPRYDIEFPGWDRFAAHDSILPGDWDDDGDVDLYLWNPEDWSMPYLATLRSDAGSLTLVSRWDGFVEGWDTLARHDEILTGQCTGDGQTDLHIWNRSDYENPYLGELVADGLGGLTGWWQEGVVNGNGAWSLDPPQRYLAGDFFGESGYGDLLALTTATGAFGRIAVLRGQEYSLAAEVEYPGYIHDYPSWVIPGQY